MYVLTVTNQKGGVGKTTTAAALATGFSRLDGKRVLAVDIDPQCNLSLALGGKLGEGVPTARDVLDGSAKAADAVQGRDGVDLIPSDLALAGADRMYIDMGATYRLREELAALGGAYDVAVIDTPPTLGILTLMALTAADGLIVPVNTDSFSIQAVSMLLDTVATVRKYSNPDLAILGYLICRYDGRSRASRDYRAAIERMARRTGVPLFGTVVREGVAAREANGASRSIFDASSKQAEDYGDVVREVAGNIGRNA